jgi:Fe-S cluster biosynthesis and repair protein YggX
MEKRSDNDEKLIVMDLDDTLFIRSSLTKFLFWLSNQIYKVGFIFEKLNKTSFDLLKRYERRIILTSRADNWMNEATLSQLRRHKVPFNSIIMCPRASLYREWKKKIIEEISKKGGFTWVDNDRLEVMRCE